MQLEKSSAVVSGGASGLGFATAKRIVAAGGQAVLLDINEEQGAKSAADLGKRARFIRTDISSESEVQAAIGKAVEFMGRVSLAVNCAGILLPARVLGKEGPLPAAAFSRSVNINLVGSFILIKEAANVMQRNEPNADGERGVIVNTASVAAFEGQIGQAGYSASKGGVVGMTLPIARELARFGIRVVTIAPGIFLTPMMAGLPQEVQDSLGAQVPFPPRLGRPEEYADLVASIYGNAMINGETIRLDGGIRMQPK
jgi:NAD(P)-dependent dehydrogenase (short-subunit alcohol dehydrogenase family)